MKTIASVVEQYIKSKPFLLSGLSQNIINLTSLSRMMMPEIEQELGKEVKQGAIVMALKRISEELDFRINHRILKVMKNIGEITLRSSLVDYTYVISETLLSKQLELMSKIGGLNDVFYTSSRGVNETNIVVSESVAHFVDEGFEGEKLIQKTGNLASITVKLPKENTTVPGIYYYIFQKLAWEGVILNEVISTTNEFTIIVEEAQVDAAFRVIKNLKSN
ncbi:MAG: aspartate kinase [Flavobacterium sp.]